MFERPGFPVIFDHWDENTFIINGPHGATLLEATAVVAVTKKKQTHHKIWKLISDAWLDIDDGYRIRPVGFYFARYGLLVTWPLTSLEGILTEGDDPKRARDEFVTLANRLRAEDYARRLAWRSGNTLMQHRQDRRLIAALLKGAPEPWKAGMPASAPGSSSSANVTKLTSSSSWKVAWRSQSGRAGSNSSYTARPSSRHFST